MLTLCVALSCVLALAFLAVGLCLARIRRVVADDARRRAEADSNAGAREAAAAAVNLELAALREKFAAEVTALRPNVRVLYMSGYAESERARHGVTLEPSSVLEKPFTPSRLTRFVHDALENPKP